MDIDDEDSEDCGKSSVSSTPAILNEVVKRPPAVCKGSDAKRLRYGPF
jgi:hypothetical protein